MGGMFKRSMFPEDTGFGFGGFQLLPSEGPLGAVPRQVGSPENHSDAGRVGHIDVLPERLFTEITPEMIERYQELRSGEE